MNKEKLLKKCLVVVLFIFFIGTSIIPSMGSIIAYKQQIRTQNINESLKEVLNLFFTSLDKQEFLKMNPSIKELIKQIVISGKDGKLIPGFYIFNPCDPIIIDGVGIVNQNESSAIVYLHDGTVHLNDTFNGEYTDWEIAALGTFGNFIGICNGSGGFPFKPLSVSGGSEYALFIESSYMIEMRITNEKYKRGVEIPVKIKRLVFPNMKLRDTKLVNPHFYVLEYAEEIEDLNIVYEEILQETWELPLLGSITWKWNQKDNDGNQVPDGNYSFVAEFEIDGIVHPVFGSGVEIVEKSSRVIGTFHLLFNQIFKKLPNMFPFLQKILLTILN
jgi:hypothetical protein